MRLTNRFSNHLGTIGFTIVGILLMPNSYAQVAPGQTDQFAAQKCSLKLMQEHLPAESKVYWRINSVDRSLVQGVSELKQDRSFEFTTPNVKSGVILEVVLSFHFGDVANEQSHLLRLRSVDPFVHNQQTLNEAGVVWYDPDQTAEPLFAPLSFQPKFVTSLKLVNEEKLVIIGESVEWDKRLISVVNDLAASGKWVIVLRGADESSWPMNLSGDGSRLLFAHLADTEWWPNKLEAAFWPSHCDESHGWNLQAKRDELLLSPDLGSQVWQFVEYQTVDHQSGCLFVGVPLMSRWSESPVPRELLSHILVHALTLSSRNDQ